MHQHAHAQAQAHLSRASSRRWAGIWFFLLLLQQRLQDEYHVGPGATGLARNIKWPQTSDWPPFRFCLIHTVRTVRMCILTQCIPSYSPLLATPTFLSFALFFLCLLLLFLVLDADPLLCRSSYLPNSSACLFLETLLRRSLALLLLSAFLGFAFTSATS